LFNCKKYLMFLLIGLLFLSSCSSKGTSAANKSVKSTGSADILSTTSDASSSDSIKSASQANSATMLATDDSFELSQAVWLDDQTLIIAGDITNTNRFSVIIYNTQTLTIIKRFDTPFISNDETMPSHCIRQLKDKGLAIYTSKRLFLYDKDYKLNAKIIPAIDNANGFEYDISPDGKKIIYATDKGIYSCSSDFLSPKLLVAPTNSNAASIMPRYPIWSDNGNSFMYREISVDTVVGFGIVNSIGQVDNYPSDKSIWSIWLTQEQVAFWAIGNAANDMKILSVYNKAYIPVGKSTGIIPSEAATMPDGTALVYDDAIISAQDASKSTLQIKKLNISDGTITNLTQVIPNANFAGIPAISASGNILYALKAATGGPLKLYLINQK
jgi:hypothetical protein